MTETTRRKTISDDEITKEVLDVIMGKMFEKFTKEEIELTQQNIIKTLLGLSLSIRLNVKLFFITSIDLSPSIICTLIG